MNTRHLVDDIAFSSQPRDTIAPESISAAVIIFTVY